MTDIEKQAAQNTVIERTVTPRRRDRETQAPVVDANFFAASETTSSNISTQLKDFDNKYKPTDISQLYSTLEGNKTRVETEHEVQNVFNAGTHLETAKPRAQQEQDNSAFVNITNLGKTISPISYEVPVPEEFQDKKFSLQMNLRGKLVVMVTSVVMLCLLFLAIFNGVLIKNLNSDIDTLNSQITTEAELLSWMEREYNNVTSEDELARRVENAGFYPIPDSQIVEFSLIEEAAEKAKQNNENWFDAFCNFLARIFGG